MRKKSLTPDQNGQIWVNIGWKLTKGGKRSQARICLGDSLKDAEHHRQPLLHNQLHRGLPKLDCKLTTRLGNLELSFP